MAVVFHGLYKGRQNSLPAASAYVPHPGLDNGFFTGHFATYIMNRIFADNGHAVANDLVVPKEGVFAANGHPSFPVVDPLVFADSYAVWHGGFFSEPRTIRHIEEHLEIAMEGMLDLGPLHEVSLKDMFRSVLRDTSIGVDMPSLPGVTVQREPAIAFHEAVYEAEPNPLTVSLSEIAGSSGVDDLIGLDFTAGEEQIVPPVRTVSKWRSAAGLKRRSVGEPAAKVASAC